MDQGFVGRQPIYSDGINVFAYELFSQSSELNQAAFANGDTVTAEALLHECIDVGLGRIAGPHRAFVPVTRDFIANDYPWLLPKDNVVLQIDGETASDPSLFRPLLHLSVGGYSVALKDFKYNEEYQPIMEVADIVKLNVRHLDQGSLARQTEALHTFDVKLLAEEVETHKDYQYCRKLGFDYFEGYFFCKPPLLDRPSMPSNRLSTLHLLSLLQNPYVTVAELEKAVGQDVAMTYRILRYLNSPMNSLRKKVDSIRHGITLVGTDLIRKWASVAWLGSIEERPHELMVMSMVRAHACQQLAAAMRSRNLDQFFTVGLLSLIDALMDRPMALVLQDLPLKQPLKDVLLNRTGIMGDALNCVEAYEHCDWTRAICRGLDQKIIREAYLSGVEWARAVLSENDQPSPVRIS
jgi:EAL and modified HD-GYP domain-containing signal transduction protein